MDTYYNGNADFREAPESYVDDQESGLQTDPFTHGVTDLRIWSAPEYFLQITIERIIQVSYHWQKVVDRARESIVAYKHNQVCFLSIFTQSGFLPGYV